MNQGTTTDIVKKEPAMLAEYSAFENEMAVDAQDLVLGKVLTMQGLSALVADDKAKIGEIRDSLTGQLLAGKGETMELICFHPFKNWVINVDGQFDSIVPFTPENANWEWEEVVNGKKLNRLLTLNYYCLSPADIAKGEAFPRLISFRSTAYKTGKKLESMRLRYAKFKKPLASKVFSLTTVAKENEKGKWLIPDVAEKRDTTPAEMKVAVEWATMIAKSNVKVDHSDLSGKADIVDTTDMGKF